MLHVENVHNHLVNNMCHNPFMSALQTVFQYLNWSSLNIVIFILKISSFVVENLHASNS